MAEPRYYVEDHPTDAYWWVCDRKQTGKGHKAKCWQRHHAHAICDALNAHATAQSELATLRAVVADLTDVLASLPNHVVAHRVGEGEGQENRQLYTVQLRIIRQQSVWIAGYGWPDYEAPFVTGTNGTDVAALVETLTQLATLTRSNSDTLRPHLTAARRQHE